MVGIRTVAALVSVVNGIWVCVAAVYWESILPYTSGRHDISGPGPNPLLLALGIVLLVASLLCFLGFAEAFYGAAGLSVLVILLDWASETAGLDVGFALSVILAAATVALDVVAAGRKRLVSEENHPLNLPVFG